MSENTSRPGSGRAQGEGDEPPPFRYGARMAGEIEARWQDRWEADGTFNGSNPAGPLAGGFDRMAGRPKFVIMDMFPYPSGAGLHVGHPLGYIATDVYARYLRMSGHNVLHTMGYDAFGLPAEQYAVETGQHPAVTTEANIATMQTPAAAAGPGPRPAARSGDHRSRLLPMDAVDLPADLQLLVRRPSRAGPADHRADRGARLRRARAGGRGQPGRPPWAELSPAQRRQVVDGYRLAYSPELWSTGPRAGHRAGQRGGHRRRAQRARQLPGVRRPLRQWMMRITAYADRLIDDLDRLDWPESIKIMQRNWIGRQ